MKTVRRTDLNITTAESVGLSSRTDSPDVQARANLASTDPVALDYYAAKYLLFLNSNLSIHNPDNEKGPLYPILMKCAESREVSFWGVPQAEALGRVTVPLTHEYSYEEFVKGLKPIRKNRR